MNDNKTMPEEFVPGEYTALVDLNIRTQMETKSTTNFVGTYMKGVPFRVYKVYDEVNGIIWGRVSSNTGSGKERFVGLRVNTNVKASLEVPYEEPVVQNGSNNSELYMAIHDLTVVIKDLIVSIRDLVNKK